MVGLGTGPYIYEHEVFRDFFNASLIVLGIVGADHPHVPRAAHVRPVPAADRRAPGPRAARSCAPWGDDTLDYFALRRDKNYFFSDDGRSLIAYVYVRGTAMVAADPIGPPEDTAKTLDEFLAFCAAARLAGGVLRGARGRRRDLPRPRDARDLPGRRGDPALPRVPPRGRRDEGGQVGGQPDRQRPRLRADLRDRRQARADRRAQRDQRRVAQGRAGARVHDGARPGGRGRPSRTS